jgi:phenylpropionate dioxygenase-like ring-hydroxylating dioxygenase large terminal subunit
MGKIDPYTGNKEIFREFDEIFSKLWIPIGVINLIHNKNDYILRNVGGRQIIVFNEGNEIKAFLNRCPHRNAKIFSKSRGNGNLYCSFHGWTFSNNGELLNIPYNKEKYGFDRKICDKIRLQEFAVKIVGKFIFLNLDLFPIDFNEQFDDKLIEELENISQNLDSDVSITSIPIEANWKLMMEITKDEMHIPFVHSKTFKIKYEPTQSFNEDIENLPTLKEMSYGITSKNNDPQEIWFKDVLRYKNDNLYYDFFFFPNLHLFSGDAGHSFGYSIYFPEDVDKTIVDYAYITRKKIKNNRIFNVVHAEAIKYGLKVYSEDIKMMENVQSGTSDIPGEQIQGMYEVSIVKFRKFIKNLIEKK